MSKWDRFSANAIFLQPTWACAKSCGFNPKHSDKQNALGCYVKQKEHKFGSEEMDIPVWEDVLTQLVSEQKTLRAAQVTMALDTLPKTAARLKMQLIFADYNELVSDFSTENDTEFHFTVNSVNDLQTYDPLINQRMNLVSISHLKNADEIHTVRDFFPKAKINYNVMSGDLVSQVNSKGIDHVRSIVKNVDSVYVLLSKAPMGLPGHDFNGFFQALEILKQFKAVKQETDGQACALPDLSSKFIMDGCMVDAAKFNQQVKNNPLKTGFGCAANVSRFQVWPDGRVTGCAYNSHNQYGKLAESFDDVIENFQEAKQRYEFDGCSIPKGLVDYSNHKRLQVIT